ncbi:unnamed protein product [Dovyalis caffra]|uniref:Uncharacterized protein n=1 Tax=Dovyalis caffra TaxID=77055 RepID=A0AAV1RF16_9ROSI|nr:unnamed protein product [Dovyalis caffra]
MNERNEVGQLEEQQDEITKCKGYASMLYMLVSGTTDFRASTRWVDEASFVRNLLTRKTTLSWAGFNLMAQTMQQSVRFGVDIWVSYTEMDIQIHGQLVSRNDFDIFKDDTLVKCKKMANLIDMWAKLRRD